MQKIDLSRFRRLFLFLLVGLPAFLIAIPLNWMLVEKAGWAIPTAYALVLIVQVTINFFACIRFVFERDTSRTLLGQYLHFMGGILIARIMDWGLYLLLISLTDIYFIIIQIFNVVIFSVLKFLFARMALEGVASKP